MVWRSGGGVDSGPRWAHGRARETNLPREYPYAHLWRAPVSTSTCVQFWGRRRWTGWWARELDVVRQQRLAATRASSIATCPLSMIARLVGTADGRVTSRASTDLRYAHSCLPPPQHRRAHVRGPNALHRRMGARPGHQRIDAGQADRPRLDRRAGVDQPGSSTGLAPAFAAVTEKRTKAPPSASRTTENPPMIRGRNALFAATSPYGGTVTDERTVNERNRVHLLARERFVSPVPRRRGLRMQGQEWPTEHRVHAVGNLLTERAAPSVVDSRKPLPCSCSA